MKLKYLVTIIGAASLTWSCVDGSEEKENVDNSNNEFDITDILVNAADNIILPQFKDLKESTIELNTAYNTFKSSKTSENLLDLQEKHKESSFLAVLFVCELWQYEFNNFSCLTKHLSNRHRKHTFYFHYSRC
jgi:hypothetical protein